MIANLDGAMETGGISGETSRVFLTTAGEESGIQVKFAELPGSTVGAND